MPALYNGIFGFDPCRNHYPNEGNPGMTYTRDQIGVLARTMADILIYDRAVGGTYTYTCTLADILIYDRAVGGACIHALLACTQAVSTSTTAPSDVHASMRAPST